MIGDPNIISGLADLLDRNGGVLTVGVVLDTTPTDLMT